MLPNSRAERRLFQIVVWIATLVPLSAGAAGIGLGPRMMKHLASTNPDLESHFRYLSGLLFGIGVAFAFSAAQPERRAGLFRALGFIVIAGGLARLLGVLLAGWPGAGDIFGLAMEVVTVPLLLLWLRRIERLEDRRPRKSGS